MTIAQTRSSSKNTNSSTRILEFTFSYSRAEAAKHGYTVWLICLSCIPMSGNRHVEVL